MKKIFFLLIISLSSYYLFSDEEIENYVDEQHNSIFGFIEQNKNLLETDKDQFMLIFEEKFSSLIPPEEISKRVMGKKIFLAANDEQRIRFNEKFKNTLLDAYSGALSEIGAASIKVVSHAHPLDKKTKKERTDAALVTLKAEFSGRSFELIYKMKKIGINDKRQWKVVGIILEGIDIVNVYRKQFRNLVNNSENIDQAINLWDIEEDTIDIEN